MNTTETTALDRYIATHDVTVDIVQDRGFQTEDGWEHHAYVLSVRWADGRTFETPWKQGIGVADSPTDSASDVLHAIVSDCTVESFEDWCEEYGYDTHSRKAKRTWHACYLTRGRLVGLLGLDGFAELQSATYDA